LAEADEAVRDNPEVAEVYRRRAKVLEDQRQHERVIADYTEALRLEPDHAGTWYERGWQHRRVGNLEQALADYTEAVKLEPTSWLYRKYRAMAYREKGNTQEALADYTEALRLRPEDADILEDRAGLHARLGDHDAAIADYREAMRHGSARSRERIPPLLAEEHAERGDSHEEAGRYEQSVADLREALILVPDHLRALNMLAWILATCPRDTVRNGQEAVTKARWANELSEWKNALFLDTLAASYAEVGAFAEAVEWAGKAVALAKNEEEQEEYQKRLALYRAHRPFRGG
jgi:tetratricopeptide (TPR) repeat protein